MTTPAPQRPDWAEERTPRRRLFVVGFDPGETTGWAVMRLDYQMLVEQGFLACARANSDRDALAWDCGDYFGSEMYGAECMMALLRGMWGEGDWSPGGDVMVVVIEDFILQKLQMDRSLLSPVRVTAMFDYMARKAGLPFPRVMQMPVDALRTVEDGHLQNLGLFSAGGRPHKRDATRHIVLFARRFSSNPAFRTSLEQRLRAGMAALQERRAIL